MPTSSLAAMESRLVALQQVPAVCRTAVGSFSPSQRAACDTANASAQRESREILSKINALQGRTGLPTFFQIQALRQESPAGFALFRKLQQQGNVPFGEAFTRARALPRAKPSPPAPPVKKETAVAPGFLGGILSSIGNVLADVGRRTLTETVVPLASQALGGLVSSGLQSIGLAPRPIAAPVTPGPVGAQPGTVVTPVRAPASLPGARTAMLPTLSRDLRSTRAAIGTAGLLSMGTITVRPVSPSCGDPRVAPLCVRKPGSPLSPAMAVAGAIPSFSAHQARASISAQEATCR